MAVSAPELSKYQSKRVVVVRNLAEPNEKGERAVEIEGLAQAANALGVLIKPKGKTNVELIELHDIEEISFAPEKNKILKPKSLRPVTYGQAKSHLLERHGYTLTEANALTEEEALETHDKIDHVEDDLGHIHEDKSDTPAGRAVAEASDDDEDDEASDDEDEDDFEDDEDDDEDEDPLA